MPRIVFFITFLSLFFATSLVQGASAADSAYNVTGVQVDVTAESAVKARGKAFIEAQRKAFSILAERYKTAEESAVLKPPSDDILSGLIQDFEISAEQLSTKRYRGVFDFRFKPMAVNSYFGHGPVNYAGQDKAVSQAILIIPYYQEGKNPAIFDKSKNPFWASLQSDLAGEKEITLPEGSISDMTDIGDVDPYVLSSTTLRRLKARYEVSDIVIALARVNLAQPQSIVVEIFKTDQDRLELSKTISASPSQVAKMTFQEAIRIVRGAEKPQNLEQGNSLLQSEINPEHFNGDGRREVPDAVRQKMEQSVENAQNNRKGGFVSGNQQQVAISQVEKPDLQKAEVVGEISVKVYFGSMAEWILIQKEIYKAEGVGKIRITSLKTNQVDIVIGYIDWNRFVSSLQRLGMALEPQIDKTYILKRQSNGF